MRDKLIHRYFEVDYQIIDRVIKDINPKFNRQIKEILDTTYRNEYLKLKEQLSLEEVSKSLPYFTRLNKLKDQDILICQEVLNTYPNNAVKIAVQEAEKVITMREYISTIDKNNLCQRQKQISEIIYKATKMNEQLEKEKERE